MQYIIHSVFVADFSTHSLFKGAIPTTWKQVAVMSVYKGKGQRDKPNNYCPIKLCQSIVKLLKRIYDHLINYVMDNQL